MSFEQEKRKENFTLWTSERRKKNKIYRSTTGAQHEYCMACV